MSDGVRMPRSNSCSAARLSTQGVNLPSAPHSLPPSLDDVVHEEIPTPSLGIADPHRRRAGDVLWPPGSVARRDAEQVADVRLRGDHPANP